MPMCVFIFFMKNETDEKETDRQTNIKTERQTNIKTDSETNIKTDRQKNILKIKKD